MPDQFADLTFPAFGLDVVNEFQKQRARTTPLGFNCRAFEPLTGRQRGGSRVGLSRYINGQVGGVTPIQELALVVDPQAAALGISFFDVPFLDPFIQEIDFSGWLLADGSVNWLLVGGSGYYTNRAYRRKHPPPDIQFLQSQSYFDTLANNSVRTVAFGQQVGIGDLLIVAVTWITSFGFEPTHNPVTVTDSLGNTYSQIGPYVNQALNGDDAGRDLSLWYTVTTASGPCTVTVTPGPADPTGGGDMTIVLLEYTNNRTSGVLDGANHSAAPNNLGTSTSMSTGSVPVSASHDMALAVFMCEPFHTSDVTLGTGLTLRVSQNNPQGGQFAGGMVIADDIGVSSALTMTATLVSARFWLSLGASFKKM